MNQAWLEYRPLDESSRTRHASLLDSVSARPGGPVAETARRELARAIHAMTGSHPRLVSDGAEGSLALRVEEGAASRDGFMLSVSRSGDACAVVGGTEPGLLYGVFRFIRLLQTGALAGGLSLSEAPRNAIRMVDHWDNLDGSVERGYAGRSLFLRDGAVAWDRTRVEGYARLLASVGINAVCLNNVNVHVSESRLVTDLVPHLAGIADLLREYGIRVWLSVNFASPIQIGGLAAADPCDASVSRWWKDRAAAIYAAIPDFGGFLVKADSEGRPGPFTYGRTHADGANMLARALEPHGGVLFWRCFVYNCAQDWRDRKTDRARAAFDHFKPLDGEFAENVVLQIKNGPVDFQVREPVSPLFGGMRKTNQVMELQITQEYTGQQRHLCCLVPQWKEYLDTDMGGAPLKRIVDGSVAGRKLGGLVGVSNIGDSPFWTGHPLAQCNLYGFGRLAWDPDLAADDIIAEWTALTLGADPTVRDTASRMLRDSWRIYESYTAPLGVGWMVNPDHHYGPSPDGYEYSRWGTYHFADWQGIGVDRTVATGSGFIAQYHPEVARRFESRADCPDELLLFFHHVPYTHRLRSGKTVIQHIYDSHWEGAVRASELVDAWRALEGRVEDAFWREVLSRLEEQGRHAQEWRDVINTYFHRKCGIPDQQGRKIY